jgi:outer membrane protein
MKNFSLVLNVVLFVLVGILFYLHFKGPASQNSPVRTERDILDVPTAPVPVFQNLSSTSGKIVFIDYDSLVQNYDLFKKMEKELAAKLKNSETTLLDKQKKLEEEYQAYMQGQSMMTDQHKALKEQQLTKQNQELIELRDQSARQFANQEQQLNEKLLNNLYGYFRKLAKQNNFSYIFTYKRGIPGIVYGEDSLDITKAVVKGLNQEYREKQKPK